MDIKYTGTADVRILTSEDVRPLFDEHGTQLDEEPWSYTWEAKFGAVLSVDDAHAERVLEVGDFRSATDDELQVAIDKLTANQQWGASEAMRQRRAQLMSESTSLAVDERQLTPEDQRPELDDDDSSNDDQEIDQLDPEGGQD